MMDDESWERRNQTKKLKDNNTNEQTEELKPRKNNKSKFSSSDVENKLSNPKRNQFVGAYCIEIETWPKEVSKEKSHPKKDDNLNSMTHNECDALQIKVKLHLNDSVFSKNTIATLQKETFEKI